MKKLILVFFAILFILLLGVNICRSKKYLEITQYKYDKTESVFEGKLKNFDETQFSSIEIFKLRNMYWIINGERYTLQKTRFSIYDPTVNWKINLSVLTPCGVCGDIRLYSFTGEYTNELLVAEENDKLYLMCSSDVLSPFQYSISDFSYVGYTDEITPDNLSDLWMAHLSGENNIQFLLIDHADFQKQIELKLKFHPELIYSLSYCEYNGDYFSKLPFDETSNNYYSTIERLRNQDKTTRRHDKTGDGSVSYSQKS